MLISKNKFFKGLALVLAVMMILPAVLACTDEAAQQSISEIKDSMLSEQDVKDIVAEVLAANPGVSADDIKDIVKDATSGLASSADVDKAVSSAVDSAVKDAVKDLPSKSDVDAAIKDAVGKIEEGNKTEAEADAALVAKITAAKAEIEVIKDTYASKKANFSDEDYAKILTLITTAASDVAAAKTAADVDAIVAKLNSDLDAFASYALKILTASLVLEEKIAALLVTRSVEIEDEIAALKALVKEAVAHYYATNNATTLTELTQYVIGKDVTGKNITFNVLQFVGATVTTTAGSAPVVSFNDAANGTIVYEGKYYTPVMAAYNARIADIKAIEAAAVALVAKIKAIGTVNLSAASQAKIADAKTAYNAYQAYLLKGFDQAFILDKITNKDVLFAAETRTIELTTAKTALTYVVFNNGALKDAFKTFQTTVKLPNYSVINGSQSKIWYTDEDAAYARALLEAITAWANAYNIPCTPELKKDFDSTILNDAFSIADDPATTGVNEAFAADFPQVYWCIQMIIKPQASNNSGTNGAYQKMKEYVQEIAAINAAVGTDVTRIDAAMRTRIDTLCKNIINNGQKYAVLYKYNDKQWRLDDSNKAKSFGQSAAVAAIKAAAAQLNVEIDTTFCNSLNDNQLVVNNVAYPKFNTSTSNVGRFMVGFNETITKFMVIDFAAADTKINGDGGFKKQVEAINVQTADSAEAARTLEHTIKTWVADQKTNKNFDYSGDVESTLADLATKIDAINARVNTIKSLRDELNTLIDNINKDKVAKNYDGSNQNSTERGLVNTLDKPQIDAAYAKYVELVALGGNTNTKIEKADSSKTIGYKYDTVISSSDATKIQNKLIKVKNELDDQTAKADEIITLISYLTMLPEGFSVDSFDLKADSIDGANDGDDGRYLGYWAEKYNHINVVVKYWNHVMDVNALALAIQTASVEFQKLNDNKKYAPLEEAYANETYKAFALAAIKDKLIDVIEADITDINDAAYGSAAIDAVLAAQTQLDLDNAMKAYKNHTGNDLDIDGEADTVDYWTFGNFGL